MSYMCGTVRIESDEESPSGYALYMGDQRLPEGYLERALGNCVGGKMTFEIYNEDGKCFRKFDPLD